MKRAKTFFTKQSIGYHATQSHFPEGFARFKEITTSVLEPYPKLGQRVLHISPGHLDLPISSTKFKTVYRILKCIHSTPALRALWVLEAFRPAKKCAKSVAVSTRSRYQFPFQIQRAAYKIATPVNDASTVTRKR